MRRWRLSALAPHLVLFPAAVLAALPIWWAFVTSLREGDSVFVDVYPFRWEAFVPYQLNLETYRAVMVDRGIGQALVLSLVAAILTVAGGLIVNALAAFAFAKFRIPGSRVLFVLVVMSIMVPFEAIVLPLYAIVSQLGLVNSLAGLILPMVANGFVIFLLRQFFLSVPHVIYEAAVLDGASPFRVFRSVYLPVVRPALVSAGLVLFLTQWHAYFWPLIIMRERGMWPIQVALASLQGNMYSSARWGDILAAATVAAVIPLLLVVPFQRYLRTAIAGSVNG